MLFSYCIYVCMYPHIKEVKSTELIHKKLVPELTLTPLEDDKTDDRGEDLTILWILQSGDVIFAPKLSNDNQVIKRSTDWADIPHRQEWTSLQITRIQELQVPDSGLGMLDDLQDKGEVTLLETRNGTNVWILSTYLDTILTLGPVILEDL
jgi:hypothetical protein